MALNHETLMTKNQEVFACMVVDHRKRLDSILSTINKELSGLKANFNKQEIDLSTRRNFNEKLYNELG